MVVIANLTKKKSRTCKMRIQTNIEYNSQLYMRLKREIVKQC